MILSFFARVGWGVQSHFQVKPNLVLRLGWGFDNTLMSMLLLWVLKLNVTLFCDWSGTATLSNHLPPIPIDLLRCKLITIIQWEGLKCILLYYFEIIWQRWLKRCTTSYKRISRWLGKILLLPKFKFLTMTCSRIRWSI